MFTGIILDVGRISDLNKSSDQVQATFSTNLDTSAWSVGDSVALDGCCLTVTELPAAGRFCAALSSETLACTRFDAVKTGMAVNIEPALKAGDALGGHLVTGHIDGVGKVADIRPAGEHRVIRFSLPEELMRYVVVKGSVAVNGVSLTINEVDVSGFTVNLIPHTLSNTNLGELASGDRVNIETDILGRYVERLLEQKES